MKCAGRRGNLPMAARNHRRMLSGRLLTGRQAVRKGKKDSVRPGSQGQGNHEMATSRMRNRDSKVSLKAVSNRMDSHRTTDGHRRAVAEARGRPARRDWNVSVSLTGR